MADAASGDTIVVRQGTYIEDFTLKAGITLTSYIGSEDTPTVTIVGKVTMTDAGVSTISGIRLQTNSDNCISITGTAAVVLRLRRCFINASNATAISASNANASITIHYCRGDIGTTGISLFAITTISSIGMLYTGILNTGNSTTASTIAAGFVQCRFCTLSLPLSFTSTSTCQMKKCLINEANNNYTPLTINSSGSNFCENSSLYGGTSSAIVITSGTLILIDSVLRSTNAATVSGGGTLVYTPSSIRTTANTLTVTATGQTPLSIGPSAKIGKLTDGGTNSLTIQNTSDTASSSAGENITVAGTSAGDPFTIYTVTGTTSWSQGIDNSATVPSADPYVISQGTALGTSNVMEIATTGEINYPLQPVFSAYQGSTDANETGDGTAYKMGDTDVGTTLTERYDIGGNFTPGASGGAFFTAPVDGKYLLLFNIRLGGMTSSHNAFLTINTSNVQFNQVYNNWGVINISGTCGLTCSIIAEMDALDTAHFWITSGGSTKVVDITANTFGQTNVMGFKLS